MTADLSQYVGQKVEVTYEDGSHEVGKVTENENRFGTSQLYYAFHPDKGYRGAYTKDGFVWPCRTPNVKNIIHIKPLTMKKYEQLENQIKELQAEVEHLKKEEEARTKLPEAFSRKSAIAFLENPSANLLCGAFVWSSTSQGEVYWRNIESSLHKNLSYKVPQEAIMAIQSWVIESYKEQYGV